MVGDEVDRRERGEKRGDERGAENEAKNEGAKWTNQEKEREKGQDERTREDEGEEGGNARRHLSGTACAAGVLEVQRGPSQSGPNFTNLGRRVTSSG